MEMSVRGKLSKGEYLMTLEQILIWVVIGATAGFLAESLLGGVQIRLIGTILIGILGSMRASRPLPEQLFYS